MAKTSKISKCGTCGYTWPTGIDGSHSCALILRERNAELIAALLACKSAIGLVLNPLDDEELKQPVFRTCDEAWDLAEIVLKRQP